MPFQAFPQLKYSLQAINQLIFQLLSFHKSLRRRNFKLTRLGLINFKQEQDDSAYQLQLKQLEYQVLFKLESLRAYGALHRCRCTPAVWKMLKENDTEKILMALDMLGSKSENGFTYRQPIWDFEKQLANFLSKTKPAKTIPSGCVATRRVLVTPTTLYFAGPEWEVSNRLLRRYHEHLESFLRVSFVEENLDKILPTPTLLERMTLILRKGMQLKCVNRYTRTDYWEFHI